MVNKNQNKRCKSNSEKGENRKTADTHALTHTRTVGSTTVLEMLATPKAVMQLQSIYVKLEQRTDNAAGKRQKPEAKIKLNAK